MKITNKQIIGAILSSKENFFIEIIESLEFDIKQKLEQEQIDNISTSLDKWIEKAVDSFNDQSEVEHIAFATK